MATAMATRTSKSNWLRLAKQQLCTCITLFVNFFAVTARLRRELPNFTFYRQSKHTTTYLSYSVNLDIFLKNSTPGEFAYIKHSDRVRIIALKFHRSRSHFLSDVFAAVAVVVSSTPCYCSCRRVIMHKFGYLVSYERNFAIHRDVSAAHSCSSSCDVVML